MEREKQMRTNTLERGSDCFLLVEGKFRYTNKATEEFVIKLSKCFFFFFSFFYHSFTIPSVGMRMLRQGQKIKMWSISEYLEGVCSRMTVYAFPSLISLK